MRRHIEGRRRHRLYAGAHAAPPISLRASPTPHIRGNRLERRHNLARNWTPEERARQAEIARARKPWEKSTGPKTAAGKTACARNALKHGLHSAEIAQLRHALRLQKGFVRDILARQTTEFL
mgnify:CR=1 FL=1